VQRTRRAIITGSSGLIGSEAVRYFDRLGWTIHGVDNNMRRQLFGPDGDTTPNLERLVQATSSRFTHHPLDIRDREAMARLVTEVAPRAIIHCAAQPSHDLARDRPFDDFEINAVGTLNLLEAARRHAPETPFVFVSTNKVYGDAPNRYPLVEHETRFDYARPEHCDGIDESCAVDRCLHSLFGVSKLSADVMVQEYGQNFGMPTVCFRAGCVTGANHSSAELHGFLAYVARAVREQRVYRIYGYCGKQVRDNLHASDVCSAFAAFLDNPRPAAVYNLGGGRGNSVSVVEAIGRLERLCGQKLKTEYIDQARAGDHVCYISDVGAFRRDYPAWTITRSLDDIFAELAGTDARAQNGTAVAP
jgi:CDP-paratose 2-epimerase